MAFNEFWEAQCTEMELLTLCGKIEKEITLEKDVVKKLRLAGDEFDYDEDEDYDDFEFDFKPKFQIDNLPVIISIEGTEHRSCFCGLCIFFLAENAQESFSLRFLGLFLHTSLHD